MSEFSADFKVLVVDDFPSMRKIIARILKQIGIVNIVEAKDGHEALRKMREDKFDLILLDWNMPNLDGLGVLKIMKANIATASIPVIIVTAEVLKENILAAVNAGANDYIGKPFTAETMEEKIKNVIAA